MKRYIDLDTEIDKIKETIKKLENSERECGISEQINIHYLQQLVGHLENAPAADVEEVTRCKDCIYWASTLPEKERAEAANNPFSDCVCDMWESDGFAPNDFCSHGSKRKENKND